MKTCLHLQATAQLGNQFASQLAVLVLSTVVSASAQTAAPAALVTFPNIQAESLAKVDVELPRDFTGDYNLLLIAFEREQQKDIDTWSSTAKSLEQQNAKFRFYELPTLPRRNFVYRWWLDSAMRSGIPDDDARKRTITLYLDKPGFLKQLGIQSENAITVLLVNRSGQVLWRTTGVESEEKKSELAQVLSGAH